MGFSYTTVTIVCVCILAKENKVGKKLTKKSATVILNPKVEYCVFKNQKLKTTICTVINSKNPLCKKQSCSIVVNKIRNQGVVG